MIKNLLTVLFYDPDKGWVEETVDETTQSMQLSETTEETPTAGR